MKPGDLVKNIVTNVYGLYIGECTFLNQSGGEDYTCSEVLYHGDIKVITTQSTLLELIK